MLDTALALNPRRHSCCRWRSLSPLRGTGAALSKKRPPRATRRGHQRRLVVPSAAIDDASRGSAVTRQRQGRSILPDGRCRCGGRAAASGVARNRYEATAASGPSGWRGPTEAGLDRPGAGPDKVNRMSRGETGYSEFHRSGDGRFRDPILTMKLLIAGVMKGAGLLQGKDEVSFSYCVLPWFVSDVYLRETSGDIIDPPFLARPTSTNMVVVHHFHRSCFHAFYESESCL